MSAIFQTVVQALIVVRRVVSPGIRWQHFLLGLGFLLFGGSVSAHSSSTAFLHLERRDNALQARIEVPLRDLEERLGLDANDDGTLTWGEIRRREQDITHFVGQHLAFEALGSPIPTAPSPIRISRHEGESYVSIDLVASPLPASEGFRLRYGILLDQDSLHRCLVRAEWTGETLIAGRGREAMTFPPTQAAHRTARWSSMVAEGMHHIWTGYDHLLFLLALLLPSVLHQTGTGWAPVARSRDVVREVLQVVTAFTVAHSITLCAATLGLIHLPSRLVETTIAGSILVAATANLFPGRPLGIFLPGSGPRPFQGFKLRPWMVAFVFGLVHGFGFASVLGNLGLERNGLLQPLIGFNIGVEAGQLAVVAMFLPVALLIRATRFYRRTVIPVGSVLILLLAGGWMMERALDLRFMPF